MVTTGAVQGAFTRPIPKTAGAQMRYLVRRHQRITWPSCPASAGAPSNVM
ncbi:hypothetical protein EDD94_5656 [Streptomyces sp. PanSC9]|nr:hypothetical protein EDD94_5656 [Streptomyces sp. PanSC9]